VTLQTPVIPSKLPKHGFIWWLQDDHTHNQMGPNLPEGSYQVLGITGCVCLVIPKNKAVVVRMYNQTNNPEGYNYLEDIRGFGDQVNSLLRRG
jgi:hypothetical protein